MVRKPSLNGMLNALLRNDMRSGERMDRLLGRSLCWTVTGWGISLVFTVVADESDRFRLELSARERPCDCHVHCSPKDFLALARRDARPHMEISGDVRIAEEYAQLFRDLNVDWATLLAEFFPELVVNEAARAARALRLSFCNQLRHLRQDWRDYRGEKRL